MSWQTKHFTVYHRGSSSDLRTNSWSMICSKCRKEHYPRTTMLATQLITCPKCGTQEIINYNELS